MLVGGFSRGGGGSKHCYKSKQKRQSTYQLVCVCCYSCVSCTAQLSVRDTKAPNEGSSRSDLPLLRAFSFFFSKDELRWQTINIMLRVWSYFAVFEQVSMKWCCGVDRGIGMLLGARPKNLGDCLRSVSFPTLALAPRVSVEAKGR